MKLTQDWSDMQINFHFQEINAILPLKYNWDLPVNLTSLWKVCWHRNSLWKDSLTAACVTVALIETEFHKRPVKSRVRKSKICRRSFIRSLPADYQFRRSGIRSEKQTLMKLMLDHNSLIDYSFTRIDSLNNWSNYLLSKKLHIVAL